MWVYKCIYIPIAVPISISESICAFQFASYLEECSHNTKEMSTYCTLGKEGGFRETFLFIHNLHTKSGQNGQSEHIILEAGFHVGSQNLKHEQKSLHSSLLIISCFSIK